MCAAGYKGSASTLTCNLDVVNGSVSLIGSLPNCSAALCAVDGIPGGVSHDCDRIAFLESCHANCETVTRPSTSHLPPCLVDPMAFLSATIRHFIPFVKPSLSCPSSALLDDDIVEGVDCSSLTLGVKHGW